jgi:hypothetical protein
MMDDDGLEKVAGRRPAARHVRRGGLFDMITDLPRVRLITSL